MQNLLMPTADVQAHFNTLIQHFVDYPPFKITEMQAELEGAQNENDLLRTQIAELQKNQNANHKMAGWAGANGLKVMEASAKADGEVKILNCKINFILPLVKKT